MGSLLFSLSDFFNRSLMFFLTGKRDGLKCESGEFFMIYFVIFRRAGKQGRTFLEGDPALVYILTYFILIAGNPNIF